MTTLNEAIDQEAEAAEAFDNAWEARRAAEHAVAMAEAQHRYAQEVLGREMVKARAAGMEGAICG